MSRIEMGVLNVRRFSKTFGWLMLSIFVVAFVALSDVIVYVYNIYVAGYTSTPISYPAHIAGAATGLLLGITVLKNLHWEKYEKYIWALSVFVFIVLMLVGTIWNLAVPDHFGGIDWFMEDCSSSKVL